MSETTVPKYEMNTGRAERLGVFTGSHRFFTPALPYLFGRFTDEHLAGFLADYKKPCVFAHRRFAKPVFSGMTAPDGDGEWNYVLWAVEADVWPALENYLLSLAVVDPGHQVVYRIGATDVLVDDPLAVDHGRRGLLSERLPVVVLGVDASHRAVAVVDTPGTLAGQRPRVSFFAPQPRTAAFARAYFAGGDPAALADAVAHSSVLSGKIIPLRLGAGIPAATHARLVGELLEHRKENPA